MNRSAWQIDEVRPGSVSALLRGNHYLHRMPAVCVCALSLTVGGWVRGALVWALPPNETAKRYGGVTWELLAIFDGIPGGTLSELTWDGLETHPLIWFIGLAIFGWVGVHFFQRTWKRP